MPALQSPLARRKANATIVMLARNSDVNGVVQSVRDLEDRFNRWHGYPWTFLNDEVFSEDFKRWVLTVSPLYTNYRVAVSYWIAGG